jgi:hypothetical protein
VVGPHCSSDEAEANKTLWELRKGLGQYCNEPQISTVLTLEWRITMTTFTKRSTVSFALVAAVVICASPVYAERVVLSGTHSKAEVKTACDGVGGINTAGYNGKGYGCYNPNNGVMVGCSDGGVCTGYIPAKRTKVSHSNILDFLTLGHGLPKGAPVKGDGKGSDTSPFSEGNAEKQ